MRLKWISIKEGIPYFGCCRFSAGDIGKCTDELHVIEREVLVTDGCGVEVGIIEKGKWHTERNEVCSEDITHWMYFPKPPPKQKKRKEGK